MLNTYLYTVCALLSLSFDRITKAIVTRSYISGQTSPLTDFFSITLSKNTGISFSLFSALGKESQFIVIAVVGLTVIGLFVMWHSFSSSTRLSGIAHGLVLGGALSNFIDRVRFGGVIDFIDLHYGQWHIPIFNIADACIVIGFIALMGELYYESDKG